MNLNDAIANGTSQDAINAMDRILQKGHSDMWINRSQHFFNVLIPVLKYLNSRKAVGYTPLTSDVVLKILKGGVNEILQLANNKYFSVPDDIRMPLIQYLKSLPFVTCENDKVSISNYEEVNKHYLYNAMILIRVLNETTETV